MPCVKQGSDTNGYVLGVTRFEQSNPRVSNTLTITSQWLFYKEIK